MSGGPVLLIASRTSPLLCDEEGERDVGDEKENNGERAGYHKRWAVKHARSCSHVC